jgi:hypothetical protein
MSFDGAPFNKTMAVETANVALHLRTVTLVAKAGEIILGHHTKLA